MYSGDDIVRDRKTIEEKRAELAKNNYKYDQYLLIMMIKGLGTYLRNSRMKDLAYHLERMNYVNQKKDSSYVKEDIELEVEERHMHSTGVDDSKRDPKTIKREYKEIAKQRKRYIKDAAKRAKKYKDLYRLYTSSGIIISDMRRKGINVKEIALSGHLHLYYDQIAEYFSNPYMKDGESRTRNEGYELLTFFRDYDSKYNKDITERKFRM